MNIPAKRLITAKVQGIMKTLENTPASEKKNLVSLELAEDFNQTLKRVSVEYPDIANTLPKPLSTRGPMTQLGKASASFLDLEIVCEQLLNLLGLVGESS